MLKTRVLATSFDQRKRILSFKVESSYISMLIENELRVLGTNSGSSALEWESHQLRDGDSTSAWVVKTSDEHFFSTIISFLLNLELQPMLSSGPERKINPGSVPGSDANEGVVIHKRVDRRFADSTERWLSATDPANPTISKRVDSPQQYDHVKGQLLQSDESCKVTRQTQLRAEPRLPSVESQIQLGQPFMAGYARNNLGTSVGSPILKTLRPATPILRTFREMNELIERNHVSKNVRLNQLRIRSNNLSSNPDPKYQDNEQPNESASGAEEFALHMTSIAPFHPSKAPVSVLASGLTQKVNNQVSTKICSSVVYVKGIDSNKISLRQLSNLLECFGDVEIGMYHAKKEYALLKFSDQSGAKTAIKELYGKEICGKSLLLHSSELDEIVTKYFTNGKYYHVPNPELKRLQPNKKPHHICRFVHLTICSTNELPRAFGLFDLKRLFGSALLPAKVRLGIQTNEYILEFHNTKAAIEFIMNNNYSEFPEEDLFAVLTFALKTKWH